MREGWPEVSVGDVARVNPSDPPLPFDAPFVPMDAVDPSTRFPRYYIARDGRGGARARSGDTLFARITPCLENGKVAQVPVDVGRCGGSTEFIVLRAGAGLDPDFLFIWATAAAVRETAAGLMTGTSGRQRLSASDLASLPIPLPPLAEQRRIVDLVTAMDEVAGRVQRLAEATRRGAAAVVSEIADATDGPARLGDLAIIRGGKRLPKGTPWAGHPTEHPYIRVVDLEQGRIRGDDLVFVPDEVWPKISRYVVSPGDVVVSIVGTIGEVAVVPPTLAGANLTENAAFIRVTDHLDPEYLAAFLRGERGQEEIRRLTVGTTQAKLALCRIKAISVPLPALSVQQDCARLHGALEGVAEAAECAVRAAREARQRLVSSLLSGSHAIPASYDRLLDGAA